MGLLRISRIGTATLHKSPLDISRMMTDINKNFEFRIKEQGVSFTISEMPDCVGDEIQINQVFSNLLDNAIKYTHTGGKVEVSLSQIEGEGTALTVKDTGIGISAGDLPRIFERFYRGDRSRSESGTGLGLSLARAIARAHGGDITVESRLHEGSVFAVTLPSSGKDGSARGHASSPG